MDNNTSPSPPTELKNIIVNEEFISPSIKKTRSTRKKQPNSTNPLLIDSIKPPRKTTPKKHANILRGIERVEMINSNSINTTTTISQPINYTEVKIAENPLKTFPTGILKGGEKWTPRTRTIKLKAKPPSTSTDIPISELSQQILPEPPTNTSFNTPIITDKLAELTQELSSENIENDDLGNRLDINKNMDISLLENFVIERVKLELNKRGRRSQTPTHTEKIVKLGRNNNHIKMMVFTRKNRKNTIEKKKNELRSHSVNKLHDWFARNFPGVLVTPSACPDEMLFDIYETNHMLQPIDIKRQLI